MAIEKKITKRDNLLTLRGLDEVQSNPTLVAFIDHEIELLDKKAGYKSNAEKAKDAKNAEIHSEILDVMEAAPARLFRVSELMKLVPSLVDTSNQFASRRMMELEQAGAVRKVTEKRVTYYVYAG